MNTETKHLIVKVTVWILFTCAMMFVSTSFSYVIDSHDIIMYRRILKWVPFGSRRIPIGAIKEVRRLRLLPDILLGLRLYGNLLVKRGVVVVLKKGFVRRLYLTPANCDAFVKELETRIQASR